MIDGLKLTMTGLELKARLENRIHFHSKNVARYAQLLKVPGERVETAMPEDMIQGQIDSAHDQIETLTLIRDYIVADETYRLGEFDLRFADLLPEPDYLACGCFDRHLRAAERAAPGLLGDEVKPLMRN